MARKETIPKSRRTHNLLSLSFKSYDTQTANSEVRIIMWTTNVKTQGDLQRHCTLSAQTMATIFDCSGTACKTPAQPVR